MAACVRGSYAVLGTELQASCLLSGQSAHRATPRSLVMLPSLWGSHRTVAASFSFCSPLLLLINSVFWGWENSSAAKAMIHCSFKGLSSVPSNRVGWLTIAYNSSSRGSKVFFWPSKRPICTHANTHNLKIIFKSQLL